MTTLGRWPTRHSQDPEAQRLNDKMTNIDRELAREAKAIVVLAFRNGPIEDVHAGDTCPMCSGKDRYSHITDAEMKRVMKNAVDTVYRLLWLRNHDRTEYMKQVKFAERYNATWDDPVPAESE